MATVVTGDKQLARKFKRMADTSAVKAAKAGKRAELKVLVKAMKSAVNASGVSSRLKSAARQSIGSRFGKAKGGPNRGTVQAKAGFGVGKSAKQIKRRQDKRASAAKKRPGVGVSAANVHWFVLGTAARYQGSHNKRTTAARLLQTAGRALGIGRGKRYTGKIAGVLKNATKQAVSACKTEMVSAARAAIMQTLAKEAAKTS